MARKILLFIFFFCIKTYPSWAQNQELSGPEQEKLFLKLLNEYISYPQWVREKQVSFPGIEWEQLQKLPATVLRVRLNENIPIYQRQLKLRDSLKAKILELKRDMSYAPSSDKAKVASIFKNIEKAEAQLEETEYFLFSHSVALNKDLLKVLKEWAGPGVTKLKQNYPKMPGVFGGSRKERQELSLADKPFLTPVDPEFDQTQMGKKILSDLGQPADFWSYDYNADELYVMGSNDSIYKIRVKKEGTDRTLQTRGGADYKEPIGSDFKVDTTQSDVKGRFYQLEYKSESLFGEMPKSETLTISEATSSGKGEVHDHAHDKKKEK